MRKTYNSFQYLTKILNMTSGPRDGFLDANGIFLAGNAVMHGNFKAVTRQTVSKAAFKKNNIYF